MGVGGDRSSAGGVGIGGIGIGGIGIGGIGMCAKFWLRLSGSGEYLTTPIRVSPSCIGGSTEEGRCSKKRTSLDSITCCPS